MLQLLIASCFPAAKLYKNSEIYIVLPVILNFFRAIQRISPTIQNMFEKKYKLLQILIFHNHAFYRLYSIKFASSVFCQVWK